MAKVNWLETALGAGVCLATLGNGVPIGILIMAHGVGGFKI